MVNVVLQQNKRIFTPINVNIWLLHKEKCTFLQFLYIIKILYVQSNLSCWDVILTKLHGHNVDLKHK